MADLDGAEKFFTIATPGTGGLHTIVDPQDIDDTEMADSQNVIFTGGYVQPRLGSNQLFAKPVGETNLPNIVARGTTSDGVDMLVTTYGSNFYLWDPINSQNIPLNLGSLTAYQSPPGPTGYQKFWSYDVWLGGIGTDVMYFANGVDNTTKWQMSLQYPAFAAASGDKQILIAYPNRLAVVGGNFIAMLSGVATTLSASSISPVLSMTPTGSNTLSVASGNSTQIIANPQTGLYTFSINVNPSANDTLTLTINGTAVTITFVSVIGSSPGNCLIGSNIINTLINLYSFLTNPGATNSTQVAFSAPNQALIDLLTYNSYSYSAIYFSGGIGSTIPLGTAITTPIQQINTVPICSIVKSIQTRLWAIGGKGTESRVEWSQTITPENFSTFHSNNTDPGTTVWGAGHGGVTDIVDGGGLIYFFKPDIIAQGQFIYSQDASSTYLFSLVEFASGNDIGIQNFKRRVKNQNNVDYLTDNNGITELSDIEQAASGTSTTQQSSVSFSLLSEKINDRLQNPTKIYYMSNTTALYFSQKGFWAVATKSGGLNSLILMYDYVFQYWTVIEGWPVQDMVDYNPGTGNGMYYLSNVDGSVNQCFFTTGDNGFGFPAYWKTKRYDFGDPAMPKTIDKIFVQGYIDNITDLQVDVYYNEDGQLWSNKYHINGKSVFVLRGSQSGTIGSDTLDSVDIGGSNQAGSSGNGTLVPFRCYLDCPQSFWFHNIQLKFSTNSIAPNWRVDKFGFNARLENTFPSMLILGPG